MWPTDDILTAEIENNLGKEVRIKVMNGQTKETKDLAVTLNEDKENHWVLFIVRWLLSVIIL